MGGVGGERRTGGKRSVGRDRLGVRERRFERGGWVGEISLESLYFEDEKGQKRGEGEGRVGGWKETEVTKRKDEGERVEEERRVGVRERGFERGAWVGERREGGGGGGGGEGRVGGWKETEVTKRKDEGGRVEEERRVGVRERGFERGAWVGERREGGGGGGGEERVGGGVGSRRR